MVSEHPISVLSGMVKKIIAPASHENTELVEIEIASSPEALRIRIENKFEDDLGNERRLREGAKVSVTIKAEPEDTITPVVAEV
jgi:hypothetical protein